MTALLIILAAILLLFAGYVFYGSLFASIRNEGKSIGEIIKTSMGKFAK